MQLTIGFVGQCHTVGYDGVPPDVSFPAVCRADLEARRPGTRVDLALETYYHPFELQRMIAKVLRARPRVVVIEVIGWIAVTGKEAVDLSRLPRSIRSVYDRVRHFKKVARLVAATNTIHSILPRHPRPTIAEYEQAVSRGLAQLADAGVEGVIQGPGAPNLTLDSKRIASDAPARYRAVDEMSRRVAAAHGVLHVQRWDTVAAGFYIDGSTRPTARGHSVWGRLLAERLVSAGLV